MAQTRTYTPTWQAVYRSDTNAYVSNKGVIGTGGSKGYNTYLGFPAELRADIKSSKITPTLAIKLQVIDGGEFDVGQHKESSNKASNGLPWYSYIGLAPVLSEGARSIDISKFISNFSSGSYKGIVLYGSRTSNYGEAAGIDQANGVKIQLTGDWDTPPTAPKMLYPNGNETLSGVEIFRASPATDPETDQDKLKYQFSLYDGSKWNDLPRGAAGVTQVTVDLRNYAESAKAKARVRAYDGIQYGPWDESDKVFTIQRNVAPKAPSGLYPSNTAIDRSQIQSFSWQHNDTDDQSRYELRYRMIGNTTWNTITKTTPQDYYYFNADLFNIGNYEWQIRTYDQGGLVSPWSNTASFTAADPAILPTILSPRQGETIGISQPVISWSAYDQVAYEIEIRENGFAIYNEEFYSTNRAQTVNELLDNNTAYTISIRTLNSIGLWSGWASVDIFVQFTPPPRPMLFIDQDVERGSLIINVENPYPTDESQPEVWYNTIYRREAGGDWIPLIARLEPNGTFTDFTPRSETEYEYRVTANALNGTDSTSETAIGIIRINQVILEVATNPDLWVSLMFDPSKKFTKDLDKETTKYLGRRLPTTEFGTGESKDMSFSFTVIDYETLDMLEAIIDAKQPILYRDRRRRRMFITVGDMDVQDEHPDFYTVSFNAEQNEYREART